MSREQSYIRMLEATANMQFNISIILESQAAEAEKSRNWLCRHLTASGFADHESQLKQSLEIHEQLVGVIEGLTKLEYGLAKNLKVILNDKNDEASAGLGGGFANLFDQSDDDSP